MGFEIWDVRKSIGHGAEGPSEICFCFHGAGAVNIEQRAEGKEHSA